MEIASAMNKWWEMSKKKRIKKFQIKRSTSLQEFLNYQRNQAIGKLDDLLLSTNP